MREVKKSLVRLETKLKKKESMYDKDRIILNNNLVNANNKYDTLLAQSKKDKKKIGTLVCQLGKQEKQQHKH